MTASARGLFRATGKKPKSVKVLLDGQVVETAGLAREKNDFYPTPAEPTRAFLNAELQRLRDFPSIWEPAAGMALWFGSWKRLVSGSTHLI